MDAIGRTTWVISDGWIQPTPHQEVGRLPRPAARSGDTVTVLNAGDGDAQVAMTVFFADRAPAGPYHLTVPARCAQRSELRELGGRDPIPESTAFAAVLISDVPIVVAHMRHDVAANSGAAVPLPAFAQ